jgi:hypothetical protein
MMTNKLNGKPSPCGEFADLLVDLSDGELSADQRPAVEAHIASCPACRAELRRLDASLARLRGGIVATPRDFVERQPIRRFSPRTKTAFAAGVGLACLLGIAWVGRVFTLSNPKGMQIRPPPPSRPPAIVLSQSDALRQIALIEQQARLQTSLDLMPNEPWYADQRAENEQLVAKLKSAVVHP